jgi:hypothetical protein
MNFQPVVPISLSAKLNLITRYYSNCYTGSITGVDAKQTGLSDAVISAFFSPAAPKNELFGEWTSISCAYCD